MTEKRKTILIGGLLALAIFLAWLVYSHVAANREPALFASSAGAAQTGESVPGRAASSETASADASSEALQKAPDFTVYTEDGKKVKLSDFQGKPVILNFWASWCFYCKQEMPEFAEVYAKEKDSIQFLFVDWVGGNETEDSAKAYLKDQNLSLPVYYDRDGDAVSAYGLAGIPATFFIDKDGNLVAGANQMIDQDTLQKGVDYLKSH